MNRITQYLKGAGLACLSTLWCTSPVWADDTEIFFGDIDSSRARPNVLFIIDTSGSMGSGVQPPNGKDRLDNVKDAMYQLLDELNNVNVGLMRFTNPGGPVLYPVRFIDEDINAGSIVELDESISAGTDDAQEIVGSGEMVLDRERLELAALTSAGLIMAPSNQIDNNRNDSEELNGGNASHGGQQLDLQWNQRIGVRFTGSPVPAGATITNAFIRFTGRNDGNSLPLEYQIVGELRDSGEFQNSNGHLRDRAAAPNGTTASVDWNIVRTVAADETIDTPNIAPVIQEIVDQATWANTNDDMTFILEPRAGADTSAQRDFFSHNDTPTLAPELFIEYYVGAAPALGEARTGLRFAEVDIPRGVTITEAHIAFTAERDFTSTFDMSVGVQQSADAATFSATAGDIGARTFGATRVPWVDTEDVSAGDTIITPDLSSLIETVTDGTDWCGGDPLAFVVDGTLGQLPVWAFEGDGSLAPRLVVKYEYDSIPQGTSCMRRTINRSITASTDDVEERNNNVRTTDNELNFDRNHRIGLRFTDLTIPQGAPINSAFIEVLTRRTDNSNTSYEIEAEDADDAAPYTSSVGTVSGRDYTGDSVTWPANTQWNQGSFQRSPDISELVEDVVDRGGWEPGNAMSFSIDSNATNGNRRRIRSFNESPGQAPRLVVEFEDDGTGLTSRRVRSVIADLVRDLNHNGWTPVQDTLYEAARYYTGESVYWGATRGRQGDDGGPFSYARVSSEESMVPGTYSISRPAGCTDDNLDSNACRNERILGVGDGAMYQSPIDDFCQEQSHIILLTDGAANRPHSDDEIEDFIGESCANEPTVFENGNTQNLRSGETCVKSLVRHINENDMRPTLNGLQRITTHTIGFNFSSKWLEDVAAAGGGLTTTADNATELVDAIKDIVGEVLKTDSTFVAPVAAVNEFNQLSHLSQVYFAVFRPDEFPRWRGNLKRYTLADGTAEIIDADGDVAVDSDTGFFTDDARSFWSTDPDGAIVDEGGAAENTPNYVNRNVYTYYEGSTSTNLASGVNAVTKTNNNLTKDLFGVTTLSDEEFDKLIDWMRGEDVDDENENNVSAEDRYVYGDPLHSRPIAVTYGGTEENPDVEIFFGSNSGAIQSVDADTGEETFAFFPEALLGIQQDLRLNDPTTAHPYGIDGTFTPWTNDEDRDGIQASDPEDFVRLYTGMRRGGRNYYALDVTDRNNPEYMWDISGGTISANGDDFRELGQTWSRPIKTKILLSGDTEPRDVLMFTGGYDELQDEVEVRTTDGMGRGMYIVDAITGRLIWSGGKTGAQTWTESFSAMDYSFPSTMSVVDINQDGLADMWFTADTGGQLWRFDISNGESLANLVQGGVIGDLGVAGGANSIVENRRFFASPSVALVRGPDGPELAVAIGSGSRPSPLSTLATNRMYMVRQQAVFGAPSTYNAVTEADLYDATSNIISTGTEEEVAAERAILASRQGWYFDFSLPGEKALSSPLIANDRVVFTTYTPGDSGIWCRPAAGQSLAYSVRLEDAVRIEPRPLLTPSIVDQATIIVPPPLIPDPNAPADDEGDGDNGGGGGACPNGNSVVIKLNAEDGPIDDWCNDASKTYWVKER